MRINIFSVTVALEEADGYYWTALPEYQNITFIEMMSACQKFQYWKVFMFFESIDSWKEIGASE